MGTKYTVVRYVVSGEKFEILVNPDLALDFKRGKNIDVDRILVSDEIYSDSSKGFRASEEKLRKAFNTTDPKKIAEMMLKRGELLLTAEQRRRMIEDKRNQIISFISKNYVDPKTNLPHPPLRIRQAMERIKAPIDPFKGAEEQAKVIVERLRSILPLKTGRSKLKVKVSALYAGRAIGMLKSYGEIIKQDWGMDGSLTAVIELPIASQSALLDRLASLTKGTAQVTPVE